MPLPWQLDLWWTYSSWMGATKPTKTGVGRYQIYIPPRPTLSADSALTLIFIHVLFHNLGPLGGQELHVLTSLLPSHPFHSTLDSRFKIQATEKQNFLKPKGPKGALTLNIESWIQRGWIQDLFEPWILNLDSRSLEQTMQCPRTYPLRIDGFAYVWIHNSPKTKSLVVYFFDVNTKQKLW